MSYDKESNGKQEMHITKKTHSYLDLHHDVNHTILVRKKNIKNPGWNVEWKVIFEGDPGKLSKIIQLGSVLYENYTDDIDEVKGKVKQ